MKLLCISLGCDKNLVDAERMLGSLSQDGYTFTDDEQEADVILVNTCCFINDAKEESVNTILEMAEYKKSGTCKALLVSGCMAQRYKEVGSFGQGYFHPDRITYGSACCCAEGNIPMEVVVPYCTGCGDRSGHCDCTPLYRWFA